MTLRYAHLSPGHQTSAVERLDAPRRDTTTDTSETVQEESPPPARQV